MINAEILENIMSLTPEKVKEVENYLLSLTPEKVKEIPGAEEIINEIKRQLKEVFVLLADGDGTMRSIDQPFGVAVTTEAEAKRYVKEGKVGYTHSYEKVTIFDNKDEAINFRFGKKLK